MKITKNGRNFDQEIDIELKDKEIWLLLVLSMTSHGRNSAQYMIEQANEMLREYKRLD